MQKIRKSSGKRKLGGDAAAEDGRDGLGNSRAGRRTKSDQHRAMRGGLKADQLILLLPQKQQHANAARQSNETPALLIFLDALNPRFAAQPASESFKTGEDFWNECFPHRRSLPAGVSQQSLLLTRNMSFLKRHSS